MYKDMSQYRANRVNSKVVQTWLNDYKQSIMQTVILRNGNCGLYNEEWVNKVHNSPEVAEIVADTLIGWLNSPVGRSFVAECFNVCIESGNDGIDEG